ncbi:unnamed protein product [Closterium sp. NIES-53]
MVSARRPMSGTTRSGRLLLLLVLLLPLLTLLCFLCIDATLPPFYVLVYVDDLVFATTDMEALAHVKSELQKRHTCTDLGEITSYLGLRITRDRAQRTITLTQHVFLHLAAVSSQLRIFCLFPVVTFLVLVLVVLSRTRTARLEHRTKHIALRYFLARELQQRGQLRLAYVASQANTADVFTKALQPCDHQRFCTVLACFAFLDWSCDLLFSPTLPMGWQTAMDAEMASWKSTGTYYDVVPPSGANIVDGKWIFKVKRPTGSPPVFKARYVARGFSQRQGVDFFQTFSPTLKMTTFRVLLHVVAQRDYELHSLDFIKAFLQGSLHEEIWLRRPLGFTGSSLAGTQWSLPRPVYGLRQVPREWHDTLKTMLAALGFAPSTADSSLFLRTDTSLPPFYVLVYVDDLVFATADTEVHQRFGFRYSSPQSTPLPTGHSLSAPPSDKSVEPSGPYPELVGCLMYLMTCTRPDFAYPLSILARYVAPGRHRPEHWEGYTFSLGSGSVSWRSTRSSSVLSSSCEAEIYAGAMAAQELRWLTYLLTYLGERPRSSLVLYVDNKVMISLCQEHRLEYRTKQRGQLRLVYVATLANTTDIFTNALQFGDHQHFCTVLAVPADLIKRAFLTCGISNALDGSEDCLAMAHRRSQLSAEVDVDDSIIADGFFGNNCQEPESDEEE